MMKIVIWGMGKTFEAFERSRWSFTDDVEVVAYVDNNRRGGYGKEILPPSELTNIDFDWILITSIYQEEIREEIVQMGIPEEKILVLFTKDLKHFGFEEYCGLEEDSFCNLVDGFEHDKREIDTIITGISYHRQGIDESEFRRHNAYNFAMNGQDLFYNFEIIRFLQKKYCDKMKSCRYCIIGLCYYMFEYDYSKTTAASNFIRYYPYIKTAHNLLPNKYWREAAENYLGEVKSFSVLRSMLKLDCSQYPITWEIGKAAAEADFHKNYPFTVLENKTILKDFIKFLKVRNIEPIIVIMPASKYYRKYVSDNNRIVREFKSICNKSGVRIFDYFNMEIGDNYWNDVTHLNKEGARIFTRRLEEDIYDS